MEDFLKGVASELTHGMRRDSVWRCVGCDCVQLLAAEILTTGHLTRGGVLVSVNEKGGWDDVPLGTTRALSFRFAILRYRPLAPGLCF